jgi:arylsulfatase A-like enzyme
MAALAASSGHHLCPDTLRGRTKAVRSDRWKYCFTPGDVDELYDLQKDPNELYNLASDPRYADIVREHRDHLLRWEIETEETLFQRENKTAASVLAGMTH